MNYLIMIVLFFVAAVFYILGYSFQRPIYNSLKNAYELDYENEKVGNWFIIITYIIIFFAGTLL